MNLIELFNYVLHTTKKFNFGSSLTSLAPSIFYFWNIWCLADVYIATLMRPRNRRRHSNTFINKWGKNCLKNILTTILVWSGGQCWSDGLIRFLNAYTPVFLTTINNCLRPNYEMSQTTMDSLEYAVKLIACCSVVLLIRWCYVRNCIHYYVQTRNRRSRRIFRLNNWHAFVPGRQITELGERGYLLLGNDQPPQPQRREIRKPIKLKRTQSCHLLTNKTTILTKQIEKRRKSI